MTSIVFDPDARSEFLYAVKYYEDCQKDLGRRFRTAVESGVDKIAEAPFQYRMISCTIQEILDTKIPICDLLLN